MTIDETQNIQPAECGTTPSGAKSYAGLATYIHDLMDKGERDYRVIIAAVAKHYPHHGSPNHVKKYYDRYLRKLGPLVGRMSLVYSLVGAGVSEEEFTKQVRTKYPLSSVQWCHKHYQRAMQQHQSDAEKEIAKLTRLPMTKELQEILAIAPGTPPPEPEAVIKPSGKTDWTDITLLIGKCVRAGMHMDTEEALQAVHAKIVKAYPGAGIHYTVRHIKAWQARIAEAELDIAYKNLRGCRLGEGDLDAALKNLGHCIEQARRVLRRVRGQE
jgi:hypothetical protein